MKKSSTSILLRYEFDKLQEALFGLVRRLKILRFSKRYSIPFFGNSGIKWLATLFNKFDAAPLQHGQLAVAKLTSN